VDFEAYGTLSPSNAILDDFVARLRKEVGNHPIILYSGRGFWTGGDSSGKANHYGVDLTWDAYYLDMVKHDKPMEYYNDIRGWGWGRRWGSALPKMWQFTSTGLVAGQYIDVNFYRGSIEDLRNLTDASGSLPTFNVADIPAPLGQSRNWNYDTLQLAKALERKFGVECSTYYGHGRTGEYNGIDAWVSPIHRKANSAQEAVGDSIQAYMEKNWSRYDIEYLIWWNWMKEDSNQPWFDYEPIRKQWDSGSQELITSRHLDHFHISRKGG
jgi:hypothetical protein